MSLKSNLLSFTAGATIMLGIGIYMDKPLRDWAPYIEDRMMFWEAQVSKNYQSTDGAIWTELNKMWTEIETNEDQVMAMQDPEGNFYGQIVWDSYEHFIWSMTEQQTMDELFDFWVRGYGYPGPGDTVPQNNPSLDLPSNSKEEPAILTEEFSIGDQ